MRFLLILFSFLWLVACSQPKQDEAVAINLDENSCSLAADAESCERPQASNISGDAEVREFEEGKDYRVLEQPIAGMPDLVELFFYGCRACYYLTDEISDWVNQSNIQLSLMPAHTENNLVEAARLFHTFVVLQRLDLYVDGYELFQGESELQGKERIDALLEQRNVDIDEFWAAWSGEAVNQRLIGSYQVTAATGATTTPAFLVKGKYVVEFDVIESTNDVFPLLEHLLAKE